MTSWWTRPMSREEFDAEMAERQPEMNNSKFGRMASAPFPESDTRKYDPLQNGRRDVVKPARGTHGSFRPSREEKS